ASPSVRTRWRNRSGKRPSVAMMRSMSIRSTPISWRLIAAVWRRLFDRDRLREVAWLIDVRAARHRDLVGEQLERHDRDHRRHLLGCLGDVEDVLRVAVDH